MTKYQTSDQLCGNKNQVREPTATQCKRDLYIEVGGEEISLEQKKRNLLNRKL